MRCLVDGRGEASEPMQHTTGAVPFPLVDLQINGGWGVDFSSGDVTKAQLRDCVLAWLDTGLAAFLPTLVTSPDDVYRRNLPLFAALADEPTLRGRVLGVHLEGPFLADDPRVLGAHRARHVQPASTARLDNLLTWAGGLVRLLTVAAEIPSVGRLIRHARDRGVAVSIGHSYYTSADLDRAVAAGASALTHVGNALPPQLDRHANPLIVAHLADRLTAMFIADGHHLPVDLLRLLVRARGMDRLVVVSDAAPVAGLPVGEYRVWAQTARLMADGAVRNLDEQHLVGSATGLREGLDHLVRHGVCPPAACAALACVNPLAVLGLTPAGLASGVPTVAYDDARRRFVVAGRS